MLIIDAAASQAPELGHISGLLRTPTIARVWYFLDEMERFRSMRARDHQLEIIGKVIACTGRRAFCLIAEQVQMLNGVQRRRGPLWHFPAMRALDHRVFEFDRGVSHVEICAVADLTRFGFDVSQPPMFSSSRGLCVLTERTIDEVTELARSWLSPDPKTSIKFRREALAEALLRDDQLGLIYFFGSNGTRPEELVIVAHPSFLDRSVCDCIDRIERENQFAALDETL